MGSREGGPTIGDGANTEVRHLRALVAALRQRDHAVGSRVARKKPVRELFGRDDNNKDRIKATYEEIVWPAGLIMKEGWDVYSEGKNTFCQIFLDNCTIEVPPSYASIEIYWKHVIVVYLRYVVAYRRNSVMDRLRRKWVGEKCATMSYVLWRCLL